MRKHKYFINPSRIIGASWRRRSFCSLTAAKIGLLKLWAQKGKQVKAWYAKHAPLDVPCIALSFRKDLDVPDTVVCVVTDKGVQRTPKTAPSWGEFLVVNKVKF